MGVLIDFTQRLGDTLGAVRQMLSLYFPDNSASMLKFLFEMGECAPCVSLASLESFRASAIAGSLRPRLFCSSTLCSAGAPFVWSVARAPSRHPRTRRSPMRR